MFFGTSTNPAENVIDEIKTIKKLGFDFVEVSMEVPGGSTDFILENKKRVIDSIKGFNAPPFGHSPWWSDLASPSDPIREAWIDESKLLIEVASMIGVKSLNFHLYSPAMLQSKKHKMIILDNYISTLHTLSRHAKRHNVTIMMENVEGEDGKDILYILENVPRLKFNLDIAHAFMNGGMKMIEGYVKLTDKLEHIHISDNHGKSDEHLPLGRGLINFMRVVKALKKIDYDKTITSEVYTNKRDAKRSMEKIKRLWNI